MKLLLIFLAAGSLGGLAGGAIKVPGGTLIGAMVAVIAVKAWGAYEFEAPPIYMFAVQVLVGVMVGVKYTPEMAALALKLFKPVLASTIVLVGSGVILSIIFSKFLALDPATSYLATSPGAMTSLVPLAAEAEADAALVAAFHFFRLVFIIITAPLILKLVHVIVHHTK